MLEQGDYCWGEMYGSLSSILTRLKKLKKFKSFYWEVEELDDDTAKIDGRIIKSYGGFKKKKALITNYKPGESFFRVRIYGPKITAPMTKKDIAPDASATTDTAVEPKDHRVILTRLTRNFSHSSDMSIVSDELTYKEALEFADTNVKNDVVADIVKVISRVEMSASDMLKADIRREISLLNKDNTRDLTLLNTLMMRWDTIDI